MKKEISRNVRLGIFVLVGTIFIIGALYFIGDKQNLFGAKFRLNANFYNINGLMPGNNVRFGGINVGTVESVQIVSDSVITVVMVIEDKSKPFIKKNAIASIGTDGLMGNKLINISASNIPSQIVQEGDFLNVRNILETDEMFRTINRTNEDVSVIAKNLRTISDRLTMPNSVWSILMDPLLSENIKSSIVNIKLTSSRSAMITGDLSKIINDTKSGKGTIGALLTDGKISNSINKTLVGIQVISDSLAFVAGDLRNVTQKIKNGDGVVGTLLMDTIFIYNLTKSMENIKNGTEGFDENMKALQQNFLLRRYYKNKNKRKENP